KKPVSTYRYLTQKINQIGQSFYYLKKEGFIRGKNKKLQIKTLSLEKNTALDNTRHLTVVPSYQLYDGRYSNNAWLNETPDPVSKLTWGNAFYIGSSFAKENELATGNVIRIQLSNGVLVSGPVMILPGQNHESITVNYGFGQSNDGRFSGFGINVDALTPNKSYALTSITKTGETVTLADTQMNHGLDEEQLAASGIKNRIKKILQIKSVDEINHPHHDSHHIHSLFKEQDYKGTHQWGMSIDLNACLGCSACSISCQAENNIPVVGREQVIKGREMSWLRIDRYFMENDNNETTINFMPVACVHCENAPCEQVCPVNATVHDDEGLNVMTYNRCIGTRYCANNCPYKVRRFNFFDWHQTNPQAVKKDRIHLFDYFKQPAKSTQMQFNPDVTIRMRGVMEKCTYCLQRISQAKIKSKNTGSNEPITSLKTACQQSCATGAIVFGDIANKSSDVSKKRKSKRRYDLLQTELNTKPRTIYLVKVKRTVWDTEKEAAHGHH
ncbi:MAG: 4Fe-4S dicluster domain-containing protein, partial [Candidatus Marinamargulisbacteria bacterium]